MAVVYPWCGLAHWLGTVFAARTLFLVALVLGARNGAK
jgi:hypothetical protein